jgi:hypothetical protein
LTSISCFGSTLRTFLLLSVPLLREEEEAEEEVLGTLLWDFPMIASSKEKVAPWTLL